MSLDYYKLGDLSKNAKAVKLSPIKSQGNMVILQTDDGDDPWSFETITIHTDWAQDASCTCNTYKTNKSQGMRPALCEHVLRALTTTPQVQCQIIDFFLTTSERD